MRILTWNCQGADVVGPAAVVARYDADIFVFSEVLEFRDLDPARSAWSGESVEKGRRKKGVGVVVREGLTLVPLLPTGHPSSIVLRVHGLAVPVDVVGIWTRRPYIKAAIAAIERARQVVNRGCHIVAGDFNDNLYPNWLRSRSADFRDVRRLLEQEHGVRSAYHSFTGEGFAQETRPTLYWHRRREEPFHIDYVFVPDSWTAGITNVEVPGFDDLTQLSDHRPVIVDFSLPCT